MRRTVRPAAPRAPAPRLPAGSRRRPAGDDRETARVCRGPRASAGRPSAPIQPRRGAPPEGPRPGPASSHGTSLRNAVGLGELEHVQAITLELLPFPSPPAGHAHLDVHRTGIVTQPEVGPQIVL